MEACLGILEAGVAWHCLQGSHNLSACLMYLVPAQAVDGMLHHYRKPESQQRRKAAPNTSYSTNVSRYGRVERAPKRTCSRVK